MINYKIILPTRLIGERIDVAIAQMLPSISRNKIISRIKNAEATINNNKFNPKDKVVGGEVVSFKYLPQSSTNWQSSQIKLDIVFEDDDILVINKPRELTTHPGINNIDNTLANGLLYYLKSLAKVDRAGIVHRLDKDTSGLLVVAKSYEVQQNLIKQLKDRTIKREYNAICYGHIISGGSIEEPIGRDSRNRLKQTVNPTGKEALTHYRVIEKFRDFTLVKVLLETGRTHQIRVHMSHIGHPLVGDSLYGRGLRLPKLATPRLKTALENFKFQALHAKRLEFIHPITNQAVSFKSELPEDMEFLLKVLQQDNQP